MLKRMWEGDLSLDDKQRINTRVIGYNGLELLSILQGKCKIIHVQNGAYPELNLCLWTQTLILCLCQ